jgi:hypothetical protein
VGGVLACLLAISALGQEPPQIVRAQLLMATEGAHPGSRVRAAVIAQIAPGYHINAHHLSLDYLIPTEARFKSSPDAKVEKIIYPAGRLKRLAFSKTPLLVYEGKLPIGLVVRVGTPKGISTISLRGELSYQACNDRACFAPSSVPLALNISLVPRKVPLRSTHAAVFSKIQFR